MKNRYTLFIVHFLMVGLMALPTNYIHGAFHETYELARSPTTPEQDAEIRTRKILIAGGLIAIGAAIGATAAVLCRPGHKGSSGYPGINGVPGKNGGNGMNGLDGFNGPVGPTGSPGPTGPSIPFASDAVNDLDFSFNAFYINFPNYYAGYSLIPYVEAPDGSYIMGSPTIITSPTTTPEYLGDIIIGPPILFGSYNPGVLILPASGSLTSDDNNSEIFYEVVVYDSRSGGSTDLGDVGYEFESANVVGGTVNNVEVGGLVYTYEATPTPLP